MRSDTKTLVLAGAREAHGVIAGLQARGRRVIASLPEPERTFGALPVPTRVGLFASPQVFKAWLTEQEIVCIIDASHAFDAEVSHMAALAAQALGMRYLRLLRPAWTPSGLDRWTHLPSVRHAAEAVPENARVFSNTGWASLSDYADFRGQILFLRQTNSPTAPPPYAFVRYVEDAPPFSQHHEANLFRTLCVTCLICRNVGGTASISKLLAARDLGLPVLMVDRPAPPAGAAAVETVASALIWEDAG